MSKVKLLRPLHTKYIYMKQFLEEKGNHHNIIPTVSNIMDKLVQKKKKHVKTIGCDMELIWRALH